MNVNIITVFSIIAISIGAIQKITYLIVYLCVYGINFDRLRAYFNKMPDDAEEQEELRLILPQDKVVLSEAETVLSKAENLENGKHREGIACQAIQDYLTTTSLSTSQCLQFFSL